MPRSHGAETIKAWLEDFAELARSGRPFDTSAGANPRRDYAYLEYHLSEDEHSILLFRLEEGEDDAAPGVMAYRFDGTAHEVRENVDSLTHERSEDEV